MSRSEFAIQKEFLNLLKKVPKPTTTTKTCQQQKPSPPKKPKQKPQKNPHTKQTKTKNLKITQAMFHQYKGKDLLLIHVA